MPKPANPIIKIAKQLEALKLKSSKLAADIADLSKLVADEAAKASIAAMTPAEVGTKKAGKVEQAPVKKPGRPKVNMEVETSPKKRGRPKAEPKVDAAPKKRGRPKSEPAVEPKRSYLESLNDDSLVSSPNPRNRKK